MATTGRQKACDGTGRVWGHNGRRPYRELRPSDTNTGQPHHQPPPTNFQGPEVASGTLAPRLKTGPNDGLAVVWAISSMFFFCFVFFLLLTKVLQFLEYPRRLYPSPPPPTNHHQHHQPEGGSNEEDVRRVSNGPPYHQYDNKNRPKRRRRVVWAISMCFSVSLRVLYY